MLAREMPNSRLIEADSLVELRMQPERLTGEIADFLDDAWRARPKAATRSQKSAKPRKSRSAARG
jgi:hypothetical protein